MEHGRFRNWLSHYPEATLIIACKDGSGYQLCIEAEGECLCLTDSEGGRLTFTSLDQAQGSAYHTSPRTTCPHRFISPLCGHYILMIMSVMPLYL